MITLKNIPYAKEIISFMKMEVDSHYVIHGAQNGILALIKDVFIAMK